MTNMLERRYVLYCVGFLVGMIFVGSTAAGAATRIVTITLQDALRYQNSPEKRTLSIDTQVSDQGTFDWLIGMSPDYNRGQHRGRVTEGSLEEGRLSLEMFISGDSWVPGGRLRVDLTLTPTKEGRHEGSFKGQFEVVSAPGGTLSVLPVEGSCVVTLSKAVEVSPDFTPLAEQEYPRLMFRDHDLEKLRAKAQTPLGKALIQACISQGDAISLGVVYQITGDKAYALQAMEHTTKMMNDESPGAFGGSDGHYGDNAGSLALAFDLNHDGWPEGFRHQVKQKLGLKADKLLLNPRRITRKFNWNPNSNYSGWASGSGSLLALLIYDRKGDKPIAPTPQTTEVVDIPAPRDFKPGKGVPVNDWADGMTPEKWLYIGPISNPQQRHTDYLASIGGEAEVEPSVGTAVKVGGREMAFAPIKPEFLFKNGKTVGLELMAASNKQMRTTFYFYSALKVEKERVVKFEGPMGGRHSWDRLIVAGTYVQHGDYVRLHPGVYPLMLRAHLPKINPWGKHWQSPRFSSTTEAQVEMGLKATALLEYQKSKLYEQDLEYWQQTGRSAKHRLLYLQGVNKATAYHRYTFGEGGFQVEGEAYTRVGANWPVFFETAFRNIHGHPSTGRADVTHFGPRYLAHTIYDVDGVSDMQSFSLSDMALDNTNWVFCFPVTPEEWKPAALWAWNMSMGIAKGGTGKSANQRGEDAEVIRKIVKSTGMPGLVLLYYPFDLVPQNPEGILPKVWQAPTKGFYAFRNGWKGKDDIVAQFFLKSEGEGGWANADAGSFRLNGLGHRWTERGNGVGKTRLRDAETVVVLPEDETNDALRGRLVDVEAKPDGSGSVTADMNLLYSGPKTMMHEKKGEVVRRPVNRFFQLVPENIVDLGITGTRSFAADYSGKSGVEGLFVLADRIQGGQSKIWMWQLPKSVKRNQVELRKDGFDIRQAGGVLRVTFLQPQQVKVGFSQRKLSMVALDDRKDNNAKPVYMHAVEVTGVTGDEGDFVAVITLDPKATPEVSGESVQEGIRINVGQQVLEYAADGKISIGE